MIEVTLKFLGLNSVDESFFIHSLDGRDDLLTFVTGNNRIYNTSFVSFIRAFALHDSGAVV